MSWQIDLFRVAPGQDPGKVRDVEYEWEEHPGYEVADPSDESDAWIAHVLALLGGLGHDLQEIDRHEDDGHVIHIALVQTDGPCMTDVYPWTVSVRVRRDYGEWGSPKAFAGLWQCCKVLADQAECAVFPQYDDDPTDMTMDLETARQECNWA